MASLSQSKTYAGVLAGRLDAEATQRQIDRLLERGSTVGIGVVFIPPTIEKRYVNGGGKSGTEERLPAVACVARFDSDELTPSDPHPYSSLEVAWFQDSFGLPNRDIAAAIARIEWKAHATAWSW